MESFKQNYPHFDTEVLHSKKRIDISFDIFCVNFTTSKYEFHKTFAIFRNMFFVKLFRSGRIVRPVRMPDREAYRNAVSKEDRRLAKIFGLRDLSVTMDRLPDNLLVKHV